MGKPTGKKRRTSPKQIDGKSKQCRGSDRPTKSFDEDTAMFISMSQEIKEEGNRLFQKRDHEGAMIKYENALKLLPRNHMDVSYLRSNIAACFMQIGLGAYPQAIKECSLALEVAPKYSKALMKRARCYEALSKHNLALRDVNNVLSFEPGNMMALEIADRVKKMILENGDGDGDDVFVVDLAAESPLHKSKRKKKKRSNKIEETKVEDKLIVGEVSVNVVKEDMISTASMDNDRIVKEDIEVVTKTVKLVFGEDIRWAQLPVNCSIQLVRDIVLDRFPCLESILVKYKDAEGDLVTVTTTDELRLAEACVDDSQGTFRLHISAVDPSQEPDYGGGGDVYEKKLPPKSAAGVFVAESVGDCEEMKGLVCVDDWIVCFAQLFKNHVGIDSDSYLNLHETGMKLYSEAIEDTSTCEDAQELFEIAGFKFQEMAALALFNWGNVHMSRARKQAFFEEEDSAKSMITSAFEWAKKEYESARTRYEDALKIKEDFYEALLALGQQQFEQAKLCWYYAVANKDELEERHCSEVLELYNKAEDSMERGMQKWEEMEEQRLNGLSKSDKQKIRLQKKGLDMLLNEPSVNESTEQAANMRSQIYLLWGSLLYERSVVEYKMGLPAWEESLEVSIEMFELAGASHTDMAVMVKNHCSNGTASKGVGFKIGEIVQAWNEMYGARRLQSGIPSFRLEPLFSRRVPKLHDTLEHF